MFSLFSYMGLGPALDGSQLEVLEHHPERPVSDTPLLFVHGAYAGAWCWDAHFLPYFARRGYHAYALSLRGHGESAGHESLHSAGISDYVQDVASVVERFDSPPILVGHSMGGMVVQSILSAIKLQAQCSWLPYRRPACAVPR
ncbi:alpha/beta hydrolase [Alkalilimnicola ehrlichii]|nr:alpha/beta fold hydrolase [Alkalilimnicola ehrlichii]